MWNKFLIIIFLAGCSASVKEFEEIGFEQFLRAFTLEIDRLELLNEQDINRPANTWLKLAESKIMNEDDVSFSKLCLLYKTPHKKSKGELKLLRLKLSEDCIENMDKAALIEVKKIDWFKLHFSTDWRSLKNKKKLQPYHLTLEFEREGKNFWLEFHLINLKQDQVRLGEKRTLAVKELPKYHSGVKAGAFEGLTFFPGRTLAELNIGHDKLNLLGTRSDSYLNKTLQVCHQVNEKCEDLISFKCDECRYGWFEGVSYSCPQGGVKFCAPNRCGERGWPACPRGSEFAEMSSGIPCATDSQYGFCQSGLRTYCDESHVLICL